MCVCYLPPHSGALATTSSVNETKAKNGDVGLQQLGGLVATPLLLNNDEHHTVVYRVYAALPDSLIRVVLLPTSMSFGHVGQHGCNDLWETINLDSASKKPMVISTPHVSARCYCDKCCEANRKSDDFESAMATLISEVVNEDGSFDFDDEDPCHNGKFLPSLTATCHHLLAFLDNYELNKTLGQRLSQLIKAYVTTLVVLVQLVERVLMGCLARGILLDMEAICSRNLFMNPASVISDLEFIFNEPFKNHQFKQTFVLQINSEKVKSFITNSLEFVRNTANLTWYSTSMLGSVTDNMVCINLCQQQSLSTTSLPSQTPTLIMLAK